MGVIVMNCPHCGTERAAMKCLSCFAEGPTPTAAHLGGFAAACNICNKVVGGRVALPYSQGGNSLYHTINSFNANAAGLDAWKLVIVESWPEPPKPRIPEFLPESVERALLQAERNFAVTGNEDAAGMMYRRTLELSLAAKFPTVEGKLYRRIEKLVETGDLTKQIGEWAHEIRLIGNDAAHEDESVQRPDLIAMRGLVDAILRYVFTLPGEIEQRKARAAAAAEEGG